MENLIRKIIYQVVAHECDVNPQGELREIWRQSARKLEEMGIPQKYLALPFEEIQKAFEHRLVPNPEYWRGVFRSQLSFFLVRTRSGKYQSLLNLVKEHLPDVSSFVCYGELDVILRVMGDEQSVGQIEELLMDNGYSPSVVKVESVPLFYDLRSSSVEDFRTPRLSAQEVDKALSSAPEQVPQEVLYELLSSGIVLGSAYFEDEHATSRIRAFIGIKSEGLLTGPEKRRIERNIIRINDDEYRRWGSRPVSSIYRCAGHYAYILEVICDDQEQLDRITDFLQEIIPYGGDTETLILAKAKFSPILYSQRMEGNAGRYLAGKQIFSQTLWPLIQQLIKEEPEIELALLRASPEKRFESVAIFHELARSNPRFQALYPSFPLLRRYLLEFIRGVLTENAKTIQNAGLGLVRDVVEKAHRELVEELLREVFDGNEGDLQKALKADNARWRKWGLAKWANHLYPNWKRDRLYSAILDVPDEILLSLGFVGTVRNRFAHDAAVAPVTELTSYVKETFQHAYQILQWVSEAKERIHSPVVPLRVVQEIVTSGESPSAAQLAKLKVNQEEILVLLNQIKSQSNEEWAKIGQQLEKINRGVSVIDERTLAMVKELVLPRMASRERKGIERLFEYLQNQASALPPEVVVAILANLISKALGLP